MDFKEIKIRPLINPMRDRGSTSKTPVKPGGKKHRRQKNRMKTIGTTVSEQSMSMRANTAVLLPITRKLLIRKVAILSHTDWRIATMIWETMNELYIIVIRL